MNTFCKNILPISLLFISLVAIRAQEPQTEYLNRALTAVATDGGVFISWRALKDDTPATEFVLYRNKKRIATLPYNAATNYVDKKGDKTSHYRLEVKQDGKVVEEAGRPADVWEKPYRVIATQRPAGVEKENPRDSYHYTPNDASAGDVDGDGEYELIVLWDPTNSRDNSKGGTTGEVFLDCYKMDGTRLWRIGLGRNIRAGAHYNPFMVFDFDGDGKAEMACKTAPGTVDGKGDKVLLAGDDANADYRDRRGFILDGPEYLTLFNGETGAQITTLPYIPNRNIHELNREEGPDANSWGDGNGNRCDRFLACVAYLDGLHPSLVMCRGYYTYSHLTAYDFDGTELKMRWAYSSPYRKEAYGQGAHSLNVGDVDGDGFDEIVYGSAVIDHDGTCLHSTGLGHGDALHLSDLNPDLDGLEIYMPHESRPCGMEMRSADSGKILFRKYDTKDTGRGMAADIDGSSRGFECWSSASDTVYNCVGEPLAVGHRPSVNFRIYWDGDLQDELLDGTRIDKWDGEKPVKLIDFADFTAARSCNGTKKTPNLSADLIGDWREEVLLWDGNNGNLLLFTTTIPTTYRIPCLMQGHIYRMGVAWQNSAYNQPPHLGYYLPDSINNEQQTISSEQ